MKCQSSPYRVLTDRWRASGISNSRVRRKWRIASFKFLDLPAEARLIVYRIFFGMPSLLDTASVRWQGQPSFSGLQLQPTCRDNNNELMNLLLVSKRIYKEAAPELYRVARVIAGPEKIIAMVAYAHGIACSQAPSSLDPKDRVDPKNLIRSLTILSRCGVSDMNNHNAKAHAQATHKLRTAIAQLRTDFPRLEDLVVQVSHYQDLISGGAIIRFVSPLCCLSRLKSIQFTAEDVRSRERAKAAGERIEGASRLRIEAAILAVLSEIFTNNDETVSEVQRLHKDGECIYRGPNPGVRLQRKVLTPLLKKKHRVKVAKLR